MLAGWIAIASETDALAVEPCPVARDSADLMHSIEGAEHAYRAADVDGFLQATDDLLAFLPCTADPIARDTAAALHRTLGLRAFADRDPERTADAFEAARAIEPGYRFPETLVPSGHPVLEAYAAATVSGRIETEPTPAHGALQFDGRRGSDRPIDRATLVQLFAEDGAVVLTTLLQPSDPMPLYTVAADPPPPSVATTSAEPERSAGRRRLPWWIAGGTAAVLGGGAWVASAASHDRYDQAPVEDLDRLRDQTNAWAAVGVGLGAVAVGCGVTGVLVARW